jgi:hypothetical protein
MYPLCGSGYLDIHLVVLSNMLLIPSPSSSSPDTVTKTHTSTKCEGRPIKKLMGGERDTLEACDAFRCRANIPRK